jgi:hypothetical protein
LGIVAIDVIGDTVLHAPRPSAVNPDVKTNLAMRLTVTRLYA